ncbi:MAG: nucleotide exchange factor GrpE [Clostridiaceae bacterium]
MENLTETIEDCEVYNNKDCELEIIKLDLNDITSEIENILDDRIENIKEKIHELKKEFQGKIKYDSKKDSMIDELHKELREYKDNLILNSIKPLILDLISIKESHEKIIENLILKENEELDLFKIMKTFEGFPAEIEDALYRQGIDSYSSEGEVFDAKRHKVIKTVETYDKEKDKKICKSTRKGYIWDEKIIKKEFVQVYVYKDLDVDPIDYYI